MTQRPGFVRDKCITMLRGLRVLVHDACLAGDGIRPPAAYFGLFTAMCLRGTNDVARFELMRFFVVDDWWVSHRLLHSQTRTISGLHLVVSM